MGNWKSENYQVTGKAAYENALAEIETKNPAKAIENLMLCVNRLSEESKSSENHRLLIHAAIKLSDLIFIRGDYYLDAPDILVKAKKAAVNLGDQRHVALIHLYLGWFYQALNRFDEAVKCFEEGLDMIRRLEDEDMIAQSGEFLGYYYFTKGEFNKALEHFEKAMANSLFNERARLFVPLYYGNSAAFTGQFYRAVGLVESAMRRAQADHHDNSFRFFKADLGNILLLMGKKEEALSLLETAMQEAAQNEDRSAMIWAERGLSYYYFLENQINKSYEVLKGCLKKASEAGAKRVYYAFPWILDMLFAFHENGLPPIAEYDFESEMTIALNGINTHLKGTALRIRARQAELSGKGPEAVLDLIAQSQAELKQSGNPMELAKTKAFHARIELTRGNINIAKDLALQAWEGLSLYGFDTFPQELKPLIRQSVKTNVEPDNREDLLEKYILMMDELVPSADQDIMLSRLVTATSRFFESERGGIFWFDDNHKLEKFGFRAGYNLSHEEVNGHEFRSSLSIVFRSYREDQPIFEKLPVSRNESPAGHSRNILCLPFKIKGGLRGIIYHDNTYSGGIFSSLNRHLMVRLSESLSTYIDRIVAYCRQMEEKSRLAIQQTMGERFENSTIIANSSVMKELLARTDQAAISDAPVILLGETGVGKELFARRIHHMSHRRTMPFIAVNLSSIPETLLESELFGHEKGAFTGAHHQKPGLLELADKGTLFLDEVGDIPHPIQVKLLRAVQEKTFTRIGGIRERYSDFRIITATNQDIMKAVATGRFREDLYYRLSVIPLFVPPLRDRDNDIIDLANYFVARYKKQYHKPGIRLTRHDKKRLKAHYWPGNVRELMNVIERAVILSTSENLELSVFKATSAPEDFSENMFSDNPSLDEIQRRYILHVLKKTNGIVGGPRGASEILQINRSTLYFRMKKLGIRLSEDHHSAVAD